jgi:glycosyltransferase involved in cell wall biosynthesis
MSVSNKKIKLVRVTTVPQSLWKLLEGQLLFMNQHFDVYAISSRGEKLNIVEKRENVKVHSVEMYRGISVLKDLVAIWKMYRYFSVLKPDIVHSHTPKAGMVAMFAAAMARVPYKLHTVAGMPLESRGGIRKKILLIAEKLCYRFADKIYPNSNGIHEFILSNRLTDPKKLRVIGFGSSNGIDLTHFRKSNLMLENASKIRSDLKFNSNKVFGFVGRLVGDKGINELIRAFKKVQENSSAKLLLVGKFEEKLDPLEKDVLYEIENNKDIVFVGYQKDVRPYLLAMDVFVFPTYREGLPNVLMQAGALEVPIVATSATGNTDIIENGVSGILVPIGDHVSLAEAMYEAISNSDQIVEFSAKLKLKIINQYDRNYIWEELLEEYNSFFESDYA